MPGPTAVKGNLPHWEYDRTRSGGLQRQCSKCRLSLPIEKFPCLPDPRCEKCIPDDVREKKELTAINRAKRQFAQVLDITGGATVDVPRLDQLMSAIFRQWGGFELFAADLVYHIQTAMNSKPGSKYVIDSMFNVAKLNLQANKLTRQIDVDQMTDRQLKAQRQLEAMEILADLAKDREYARPLLRILKEAGLEVTEETIEQFGAPRETKEAALTLAVDREEEAAREEALHGS